ncbi:MAG: hypothetical protein Pars2KO_16480 [Parasphingorhabdus sp.]
MVELRKDIDFKGPVVTGFTTQGFKVGDQRFHSGLLISPEQVLPWEGVAMDSLDYAMIENTLNLAPKPEFLLFGSGTNMMQPPAVFRHSVEAAGIGVEVMDSRAAARTWGVLRSEERWIIGAFLPLT